jgi:hypothetical protein
MSAPVQHHAPPVASDDRIADVLSRDPSLVDVFVRHSAHFEKLRIPALRRVMARLVTVEQAARVAGVGTAALVRDLNTALGIESSPAPAEAAGDPREAHDAGTTRPPRAPVVELDLRDALRRGEEPFARIMAAVGALPFGAMLHLRTIFEPAPLYAVLARRGFLHETLSYAADDWSVWFWRAAVWPAATPAASAPVPDAEPASHAADERWLDVRGLEPPEPMLRTLAELETLPRGHTLVQVNARVPQFLLPMLVVRGFDFALDDTDPERVLLRIRHRG